MTDLIVINKPDAMDIFTKRELITPLLEKIEAEATKESFDVSTEKGRKAIASIAYRVAQSKTYIESHGKELAAELKEIPKLVDANRKYAKDFLDALRDRIRKPLDDYEAEQHAIKLRAQIEEDHEIALLYNIKWDEEQRLKQELERLQRMEYEAKLIAAAEEKAKREAQEEAERKIREAELKAQREIEQAKMHAEMQIRLEKEKAEKDAARATHELVRKEKLEREEKERIEREQLNIQAQKKAQENMDKVHQSIIDDLLAIGMKQAQADYLLKALLHGKIKALRIEY